ncbi:MAG: hypothetical protein WA004_11120 [Saprospiraceae bacterium]
MSYTFWTRIGPQTRDKNMLEPLQARIHDPLWMLARQWQLGEFQGEDAGSPASARVRLEGAKLSRYYAGALEDGAQVAGTAFDCSKIPLETLVEQEPVWPAPGQGSQLRLAAEAGIHFFRLLDAHQMGAYKKAYLEQFGLRVPANLNPLELDKQALRFLTIMAGRVPDGAQLFQIFATTLKNNPPQLPAFPAVKSADRQKMIQIAQSWLNWCESLFSVPSTGKQAWNAQRMEYAFAVAAHTGEGEMVLVANEYQDGHLDWYSFNTKPGVSLGTSPLDSPVQKSTHTLIPAPVSYKGMPGDRFWEFEDASVNFGAIEAESTDLPRLVFIDFALSIGNDWFQIPIELDKGAIYMVNSLVVTDTFGIRTIIQPYQKLDGPLSSWRLFHVGKDRYQPSVDPTRVESRLFIPPALAGSLESKPLEEILFIRDEMANMAWAVEKTVESPLGLPLNRHEIYLEKVRRERELTESEPVGSIYPLYKLVSKVPDYWIPFVPVQEIATGADGDPVPAIRLQRARLFREPSNSSPASDVRSQILSTPGPLKMFEEEIPRAGIMIKRSYQYARWADGATFLWIGRKKTIGKGEGWSGLRFDVVE